MKNIVQVVKDILYVSKLTNTKNKKFLIAASIVLSQLTAGTDLMLIGIFRTITISSSMWKPQHSSRVFHK